MRVQFLKDTSKAELYLKGTTIVVYREGYKLPQIVNAEYIDFEKYKTCYLNFSPDNIVIVGLNRIFVPANRCEIVFEYLQTMTSHINKISIDNHPFIGEPWRFWFHYSVVFGSFLNINYSYAIETDWQHWFYRNSDASLISDMEGKIPETFSDLTILKTEFEFYQPDLFLSEYYQEVKEMAFEKYGTPKQIIQFMNKQLNSRLNIDFGFDSYLTNRKYSLPNFGIFKFLVEENQRRMKLYNTLIK